MKLILYLYIFPSISIKYIKTKPLQSNITMIDRIIDNMVNYDFTTQTLPIITSNFHMIPTVDHQIIFIHIDIQPLIMTQIFSVISSGLIFLINNPLEMILFYLIKSYVFQIFIIRMLLFSCLLLHSIDTI